jgi:hypothetical protein
MKQNLFKLNSRPSLLVVINLLVVVRLSKEDATGEPKEENHNNSDLDGGSNTSSHSSENREFYWAYSPIDLQRLADFEDRLYKEFGFQIQGQKSDSNPGDIQW